MAANSKETRMKAPSRTPRPNADAGSAAAADGGQPPHYGSGEVPAQRGSDPFTARVRAAAAARVAATSLRSVSREIGMSATGLSKFLDGNAPYLPTLNRLRNWYLRHAAPQGAGLSEQDAHAALSVLVHDLSPEARHAAIDEMVRCMRAGYQASGHDAPGWMGGLIERFPVPVEPPPRRHRVAVEDDA
jgi:hypothetical protein